MNTFMMFLLACFIWGLWMPRVPVRLSRIGLAGACVLMAIAYFYFDRI